ncbi:MAG: hypothetical protein ACI8Z1_004097, partial [Candidatus Azotimanducaceae bacterium]
VTISVDFKPTFRRVMFELTHRGLSGHSQLEHQSPLPRIGTCIAGYVSFSWRSENQRVGNFRSQW